MKQLLVSAALFAAVCAYSTAAAAPPEDLTPVIEAFPSSGQAPLTVFLSAEQSTGKWGGIGEIESFQWDLEYDGSAFEPEASLLLNAAVACTYDMPGTYTVRLLITDTTNDGPREAFTDLTVEVAASSRDPAVRSQYPPGAWGAGINFVWASDEDLAAAEGFFQPMGQIMLQWDQVQPEGQGLYDWSRLDRGLEEHAALGRGVSVQINSRLPAWVFEHIARTGTARDMPSPQFWDPDYIQYYMDLIVELSVHLAASPHRDRVIYVRQQWNAVHTETTYYDSTTSGDATGTWVDNPAWVWPPDGHRYEVEWTEAIAQDYERAVIARFLDSFRSLGIAVALRSIQSHLPVGEQNAFYRDDDPAEWILITNNTYGKWDGGEQHTREFTIMRCFGGLGFEETWSDVEARIAERNPELSVEQDLYGVVLRSLEVGLPYIGIYGSDLALAGGSEEVQAAYIFGNRYAGWHLFPRSAPGAWLVLGRFEGTTDWRRLHTLVRDNWGYFIRQNDPAGTSEPAALVGDASCRFGLTARRIPGTATFDIDDGFSDEIRDEVVELRVTYHESSGALRVAVDQGGAILDLTEDSYEDHKGWRTLVFTLDAPEFSDGADGRTDLVLTAGSGAPVVHRIEILRVSELPPDDSDGPPERADVVEPAADGSTDGSSDSDADSDAGVDGDGSGKGCGCVLAA